MIASNAQIIRAVASTLVDKVLPELAATTWPASNVRACIALLAYLEDRIDREGDVLRRSNQAMKSLFDGMISDAEIPLEEELRAQIQIALHADFLQQDGHAVSHLEHQNDAYQVLLSKIIRRMFELRDTFDAGACARFRKQVQACLSTVHAGDFDLAARAARLVPF
jgi:hypothetical protein